MSEAVAIDPAVIKRTQDILGKYVKKPNLSEKLLTKPPFRFLFDVFSVVIRDTGCFKGLYTDDELVYEKIKDRDDKMRFLQKMIDVIKIITQSDIGVRTSKIVAGHEAEKTNELLQCIGQVIEQKLDWQSAVSQMNSEGNEKELAKKKDKKADGKTTKGSKESKEKSAKVPGKETKSNDAKGPNRNLQTDAKAPKAKEANKASSSKGATATREKSKPLSKTNSVESGSKERPAAKKSKNEEAQPRQSSSAMGGKKEARPKREASQERLSSSTKERPKLAAGNSIDDAKNSNLEMANNEAVDNEPVAHKKRDTNEPEEPNSNHFIESTAKGSEPTKQRTPEKIAQPTEAAQRKSSGARRSSAQRKVTPERSPDKDGGKKDETEVNNNVINVNDTEQPASRPLKPVFEEKAQSDFNKPMAEGGDAGQVVQAVLARDRNVEMKRDATITHSDSLSSNSSMQQRPRTSLRPPSARPPSARPGAPRRRDKNVEIVLQPNDQIKMSGISVKLETFGDLDDDGENLVIIEDATKVGEVVAGVKEETPEEISVENAQQGHLVQQILETQKELVQQHNVASNQTQKSNAEMASNLTDRQNSAHQMTNLRNVIQSLTRSVNPFGKLMDFIPEDIDAMQFEFNMWRDTYLQAANELKRERNLTESATEPMKNQLLTIDVSIKEYSELIDASRTKILQNNEKILKMLLE